MSHRLILPIFTIVFSLFFIMMAIQLPGAKQGIGPGGWPLAALTLMLIMGVLLLFRDRPHPVMNSQQKMTDNQEANIHSIKHWFVLVLCVLYFFIMQYIGFLFSTPLFLFGTSKSLGMSGWLKLIILSLIISYLILYLFAHLLLLPLPRGVGVFRTISLLVY